jgi:hypothetical protein
MTRPFLRSLPLVLSTSLLAVAAFAGDAPVWPMPATLPSLPAGMNPAVFPMPRMDWVVRVKGNNDRAAKIADSIQPVIDKYFPPKP